MEACEHTQTNRISQRPCRTLVTGARLSATRGMLWLKGIHSPRIRIEANKIRISGLGFRIVCLGFRGYSPAKMGLSPI